MALAKQKNVDWGALHDADFPGGQFIERIDKRKWNKECDGAWRRDLGDFNYGL